MEGRAVLSVGLQPEQTRACISLACSPANRESDLISSLRAERSTSGSDYIRPKTPVKDLNAVLVDFKHEPERIEKIWCGRQSFSPCRVDRELHATLVTVLPSAALVLGLIVRSMVILRTLPKG